MTTGGISVDVSVRPMGVIFDRYLLKWHLSYGSGASCHYLTAVAWWPLHKTRRRLLYQRRYSSVIIIIVIVIDAQDFISPNVQDRKTSIQMPLAYGESIAVLLFVLGFLVPHQETVLEQVLMQIALPDAEMAVAYPEIVFEPPPWTRSG